MSEVIGEGVIRIRTDESGVDVTKTGKDAGAAYSRGFSSSLKGIAGAIGVTVAAKGAVDLLKGSLNAARQSEKIANTTEQIIVSTGQAAGVTASEVGDLTSALSMKAGVDDELIQSGANLVLTFKNVKNAGEGVDAIFDRTTAAALDLSAAGFGSVESASLQLGKALNDPIKGISALSRSGVTFTAQQKEQIAVLVETGDLLSAQKIILEEVESQVGGVAEATATAGDRAQVAWGNLQETIGGGLIPVVDRLANVFTDHVVPGVTATVGVVGDAVQVFGDLPGPVQTATGAFVALQLAASTGILGAGGSALRSAASGVTGSIDSMRIRTMLASDAFAASRENGGRLVSTLAAVRAGATGTATAARGLALAVAPVAILTAGITLWSKFSESQADAKARVDALAASLDERTGAVTEDTRLIAARTLEEEGAFKAAEKLGVELATVTDAYLGNKDALATLNAATEGYRYVLVGAADGTSAYTDEQVEAAQAAAAFDRILKPLLNDTDSAVAVNRRLAEGVAESGDATDDAATSMSDYTVTLQDSRDALRQLIDLENERREDLISDRRDQIALNQALKDAREESRKGGGGFDLDTGEGQRNLTVLLDLADQFNSSTNEVRRTNFQTTRDEFVRLAVKMGKTTKEAEKLADELLRVPKNAPVKFQSEGYQELLDQINRVIEAQRRLRELGGAGAGPLRTDRTPALAGGTSSFPGGTAWVGEEGPELVNLPRGTQVIPAPESAAIATGGRGLTIRIDKLMPHNYSEFERQMLEQERAAALGGRPAA